MLLGRSTSIALTIFGAVCGTQVSQLNGLHSEPSSAESPRSSCQRNCSRCHSIDTMLGALLPSGAAPTTTCEFVPPNPNDDTPAYCPDSSVLPAGSTAAHRSIASISSGFSRSQCRFAGTRPCCRQSTALISPAMPAAASRCPMLLFTAPSTSGRLRPPNTFASAPTSIGSPSAVPVPCASMYPTSSASIPALSSAIRITASCDGPFGAVNVADRPSWFTATPCTTPQIPSPLSTASDSRLTTIAPHPSPRAYPSASSENVAHLPRADSIRAAHLSTIDSVVNNMFTPTATA